MAATEFKLARAGDIALVTIDNGEDWTRPTFFGADALRSLDQTVDALELAGLTLADIGLFELNEPFAVQVLTWCDALGVDPKDERLNPYGGAIACGHPLAATGVRLMAQLAHAFRERPHVRYGLTALCVGMGMGAALIWENLEVDGGH